ncbi:MAG TPA: isoprenylcysteine carboxylmethyltransferase family protein [Chitinophagaceae bacterium]
MIKEHIILAVLWIGYGMLHSLLAHTTVKTWLSQRLGRLAVHYRLFYTLFAFVTLVVVLLYQVRMASPLLYTGFPALKIIGGLITLAGLSLMLFCIRKYFMSLSGLRTLVEPEKAGAELMITDIHQYVRHPLYLGTFMFIWGLSIVLPYLSLVIANLIITIYTLIGINLEEKKLVELFGDSYRLYKQKVPRILPFRKATPL